MKKTAPKKMTLSRETLVTLTDKEMKEVPGGYSKYCTTSVDICCP